MNINNFGEYIDETILKRGLAYYKSGCVISLEHDGEEWVAEVEGSDDYTVTVMLSDNGEIMDTQCDCPYDWGEYCKHQAAVFYALSKKWQSGETSVKTVKKKSLEDTLKNLDKQALISIIIEFANKDRRIKEELLMRYDEKTDILKSARGFIKSALKDVTHQSFYSYIDAADGAETVLEIVDNEVESGEIMTATSLCIVVLEEMMDLLKYCDDSDGSIGGVINEAIEKIGGAVCTLPAANKNNDEIFTTIYSHALNPIYDGWSHWRIDLLSTVVPLCGDRAIRNKLEQYFDERQSAETDNWNIEYYQRQMQNFRYNIIKQFDGKTAAVDYMEKHVDNDHFRRTLIESAIVKKQYEKALKLCLDGEQKDVKLFGLLKQWREYRYTVYEKMRDTEALKSLGMELLMNGDFNYFGKLKALYTKDEWPSVLHDILTASDGNDRGGVYVNILINEKLKSRLLEYCKKYRHTITSYYTHLLPEFIKDVGEIFIKYIYETTTRAGTRSHYRDVCGLIRHYAKACGKKAADTLRDELKSKYARRPAFLDELSKI